MNLRLLLLSVFVIQVNGGKKCFSPVTCSENGRSGLEWIQIYPSPGCKLSGNGNWSDAKVIRGEKGSQGPAGPPGEQGPPGIANKTITDELGNKTDRLQAEMATLIANHSLEKQALRKLLNQSTDDNTKLRKDLESSSQQTASEIDQLQREIATLKVSHSSEKQTLQKLLNQSTDDNTKLKRELESLETKIKNLTKSQQIAIDRAVANMKSYDVKQTTQANAITTLQESISSLQNRLNTDLGYPYSTCHELQERGIVESGSYSMRSPFSGIYRIYCNFAEGKAITQVSHQEMREIENPVSSSQRCESFGCYSWTPRYPLSWDQMSGIVLKSAECRQYIKARCVNQMFLAHGGYAWWVSREGERMNYWGGATSKRDGYCACGETNTCVNKAYNCNCDSNNATEAIDEGYLTDKTKLPVKELRFGDLDYSNEFVWHTLGMLECWGKA